MDARPGLLRTTRWGLLAAMGCATVLAAGAGVSTMSSTAGLLAASQSPSVQGGSAGASGFSGGKWGSASTDAVAKDASGKNAAKQDPGSLFTIETAIGARTIWAKHDSAGRNVTGQGVGVALLDSGVSQVPGLDAAGKVTYGPDLSIEGNGVLADQDTFGHGTFMAGIIAGRGATNPSSDLHSAPAQIQLGVAPDAELL